MVQRRLSDIENGKWVRVIRIEGGVGVTQKLHQLGLVPGDKAHISRHAPFGGPILLEINRRSIALGKGVAYQIFVEELE